MSTTECLINNNMAFFWPFYTVLHVDPGPVRPVQWT
jgi:hypothetical protein